MLQAKKIPMQIEVVDYDPAWPERFAMLRDRLTPAVGDVALAIEHVGSTSVPGLAAKPVIDIDVVVRAAHLPAAIERIVALGYEHLGEMGVPQREAFRAPSDLPRHNLYATVDGCLSLRNHTCVRDHLRANPDAARAYGELKKKLAVTCEGDIDRYVAGKSEFISAILSQSGLGEEDVSAIRAINAPA